MKRITITLCLPEDVREQVFGHDPTVTHRAAIYDALCGQHCWAVVAYETETGRGCDSLHFRLEGLGLPSMLDYSFDREPPPGISFVPNVRGALVPVTSESLGNAATDSKPKGQEVTE